MTDINMLAILCQLFAATASGSSKQARHIPDAVFTVLSSWWWAEKPPETCRAAFLKLFQVGTTFISQNVLRTTLLLGLSNSL